MVVGNINNRTQPPNKGEYGSSPKESLSEQNRSQENIQGIQSELNQTKEEIEKKIENINNLQSQIDSKNNEILQSNEKISLLEKQLEDGIVYWKEGSQQQIDTTKQKEE